MPDFTAVGMCHGASSYCGGPGRVGPERGIKLPPSKAHPLVSTLTNQIPLSKGPTAIKTVAADSATGIRN